MNTERVYSKMKKKILHINSYYIARGFYYILFEKLRTLGYDLRVFVFAEKGRKIEHDKLADYIDVSNNFLKWDRLFFHVKHLKVYRDLKKREKNLQDFEVVHAHSLFSNGYIAYKLKREYGVPYIVAVRGTDVTVFFKYMFFLRKLGIDILCNASKIVFISPAHKRTVLCKYVPKKLKYKIEKKSSVIPNGIDPFWLEHKRTEVKCISHKTIRLLYVGEINSNKNLVLTCQAIDDLILQGFDITLSLAGKIIEQDVYEEISKCTFVKYLGVLQKEQLLDAYNENDVFIMVSKSETFGLVYAEALTQGMPLVYSKGQGFDGFFKDGFIGYPAMANDKKDIALMIKKVCSEYERLAQNCLVVGERFSWDQITKTYDDIYLCIAKNKV